MWDHRFPIYLSLNKASYGFIILLCTNQNPETLIKLIWQHYLALKRIKT